MLDGLGFKERDFQRPAREMSGGWIMRAHLARLLVMEPDLLLLDEPTNHLDLLSLIWLQNYLKTYSGAILMISHDRQFMDELAGRVYEIANTRLIAYTGNYSAFLEQREAAYNQQLAAFKNQQKEIEGLQEFIDRFRSVSSKSAQVQSKVKQIERMDLIEKPLPPRKPFRFQIPQPPRIGQRALALEGIHMAYGENVVYTRPEPHHRARRAHRAHRPQRRRKIDAAQDPRRRRPHSRKGNARRATAQSSATSASIAPPASTRRRPCSRKSWPAPRSCARTMRAAVLGSFMFRKEEIYKKTEVLSGGEKSRLNLIKFLVDPPNLLLMDEPTTHLDILTVESLILALEKYEGTLVFISHDIHFIRKLANKVLQVPQRPGDPVPRRVRLLPRKIRPRA